MANTTRLGRQQDRTRYVLGFAFNEARTRVVLIHRNHGPIAGHWNGLGGEVYPRESYRQAMRREFFEESGVLTGSWKQSAIIEMDHSRIHVFWTILAPRDWRRIKADRTQPEAVTRVSIKALPESAFPDIRYLIALCWAYTVVKIDRRGL